MPTLKELTANASLLWLDYTDYAGVLLANGEPPWLSTTECVAWLRKAQSLLHSDVVMIPISKVCAAWIGANPVLRDSMAAKKRRAVLPLRTLLADAGLRKYLHDLVLAVRTALPQTPLALSIPSPRLSIVWACEQAQLGDALEIDADTVDSAALYLADFLRAFCNVGIDIILLEESIDTEPTSMEDLQLYQALFNLAAHYRWDIGLRLPTAKGYQHVAKGPDFVVSPKRLDEPQTGMLVPDDYWAGTTPLVDSSNAFRFAKIPPNAKPEQVLERLTAMRQTEV